MSCHSCEIKNDEIARLEEKCEALQQKLYAAEDEMRNRLTDTKQWKHITLMLSFLTGILLGLLLTGCGTTTGGTGTYSDGNGGIYYK